MDKDILKIRANGIDSRYRRKDASVIEIAGNSVCVVDFIYDKRGLVYEIDNSLSFM